MRKIALGILSVFMLFGGMLLASCSKENPSLSLSTNYMEIYTNDADRGGNYQKGVVKVTLNGSSDGIGVQVESGSDVVTYSTSKKNASSYAVTLKAIKSGNAKVKIYAMANQSVYDYLDVSVLTIPTSTSIIDQNDPDGRTSLFVVKEGSGTFLDVDKYISFAPADANVKDVVWMLKDVNTDEYVTEFAQSNGTEVVTTAKIEDNKLYVYNGYTNPKITVHAIVQSNEELSQEIDFQVIENSTIGAFSIDGKTLLGEGDNVEIDLVRNNSSTDDAPSEVNGEITINTFDENMTITPKAYLKDSGREVDTREYFKFTITERRYDGVNSALTIDFTINALYDDFTMEKRFGELYFGLELGYSKYIYSINTRDELEKEAILNLSFVPESVVIRDSAGNDVGGQVIDLYSEYYNSQGYLLSCNVYPDDIPLTNSTYQVRVNIGELTNIDSVDDVLHIYNRNTGVEIEWSRVDGSASTYITKEIPNGTALYFRSGDLGGKNSINGFEINFIATGNPAIATETITANLYHITMGSIMEVEEVFFDDQGEETGSTDDYSATKYISSARNALGVADAKEYYFKISGISSIEGLSLEKSNNKNFNISMEEYRRSGQDEEQYVIVKVTISLNGVEFRDFTSFNFNHKSGLNSNSVTIEAFNPLATVSIYNNSKGANNIYDEKSENQSYVLSGGEIVEGNEDMSLSSLLVSAGSNVSLLLDYQNATLDTSNVLAGYQFFYLDSTAAQISDEEFELLTIQGIIDRGLYNNFNTGANNDYNYFTFSNGELRVSNSQFVIYIMVRFFGYDEEHNSVTFVRFFRLESFYPVTSLRSDIAETTLLSKESLSVNDEALSSVDVSLTLRGDDNLATYSDLSYFKVILGTSTSYVTNNDEEINASLIGQENNFEKMLSLSEISYIYNDYLLLTNFRIVGNELRFNISAQSTKFQNVVGEAIKIQYVFKNSIFPEIIDVTIRQVDRVEKIEWLNGGITSQIYLNLASDDSTDKSYTINMSVAPNEAYNKELTYYYQPMDNNQNILQITTSSLGQSFTLSIRDTSQGGWGYLYLLPADMIKIERGTLNALTYKLVDGEYEPYYRPLDEIHNWYSEVINGEKGALNYFLNNDNEKVYYKDIIVQIRVTVADGKSEETAIRVYNEEDFNAIKLNPTLYYRVMNDITLNNWKSFDFSGMIFGDNDNVMLTINGESLVNSLSGVIKDLNIQGSVTGGAFVAREIEGETINISNNTYLKPTVENVNVDVIYDDESKNYVSSSVSGSYNFGEGTYAGAIAGVNAGNIIDCKVYGVNMNTAEASYVGGVAGYSFGLISGSGVEFYNFAGDKPNTFLGGTVGGLVGYFGADGKNSTIRDSYVYAFNLNNGIGSSKIGSYTNNISANTAFNAVAGTINATGSNAIETSFAFMGDYALLAPQNSNVTIKNSYISNYYLQEGSYYPKFTYYAGDGNVYSAAYESLGNTVWSLDSSIWEIENISTEINFGYPYLKNVTQTPKVSVAQTIHTVDGKSLAVDNGVNGILYNYNVKEPITGDIANGELKSYNTISVSELFGVTEKEAESLLVSVNNQEYASFSNSAIITQKTTDNLVDRTVVLTLVSRTDFSETKTFEIMILDAIPTFVTTINGVEIRDNQIVNIQTGIDNTQSINVVVDDSLYLYGERYTLILDDYEYYNEFDESNEFEKETETLTYFSSQVVGGTIVYEAENACENGYVSAKISLGLKNLEDKHSSYAEAIKENNQRTISLSSYDGANSLVVDSTALRLKPHETQMFKADLVSDNINDTINIQIGYEDDIYNIIYNDKNNGTITINDNLVLDISITKAENGLSYSVLIGVNRNYRHKVDKDYNLKIFVRPESQKNSDKYLRTISLLVQKQTIENVNVVNYMVSGKQLRNNTWYYVRTDQITSTITPGTETILALEVNPNFAHMSNFKVTYTLSNASAGTVSLSRLMYKEYYGYYINTSTTESLNSLNSTERGLMVTPTNDDLTNGTYYFRLYVSSSFTANSVINITFTFYDGDEVLTTSTSSYSIDYIQEAVVRVNGETSVILAKSSSATVTVEIDNDQTLDSIYLSGHGDYITMTNIEAVDHGTYTTYTAHINTSVLSKLANGASTGSFTVEASVVGYVNGRATYKYSYATIYLVDFTIDPEEVGVASSASTIIYGGQEYDAFHSYINASSTLSFDYQINPESYNYNTANVDEVKAVNELLAKRSDFRADGYYRDEANSYYINCKFNTSTGRYEALSLRDRLYYVNSDGSATAIYNVNQGSFLENSTFDFSGGTSGNGITIKGKQSGSVLLRLKTFIIIGNNTFEYDYDFVVRVEIWTDEEVPIPIYTAEEFLRYMNGNEDSEGNLETGDYILMNDIVLTNYTPLTTEYVNSLDGNGYTIFLNSFNYNTSSTELNLALFSEVTENTTIKNVRVNVYNGGQLTVNVNTYTNINIAGFALVNNGIIYNSDVVSFYDVNNSLRKLSGDNGIVVNFVKGNGGQATDLTTGDISPENVNIAGFVLTNNNVVTNSRVGGETYKYIREEFDERYYDEMSLSLFTVQGQGYVSGFVGENTGTISASFASNFEIINSMRTTLSETAGFVRHNNGNINTSYVKGAYQSDSSDEYFYDGSTISATGKVGGFSYYNNGTIKNSYVNFAIETDEARSYLSAGFIYENDTEGIVSLCFAQVKMSEEDSSYINNMGFSGVDEKGNSLNKNDVGISYCYYYSDERNIDIQSNYDIGAYAISRVNDESIYYRFSFTSTEGALDGIWTMQGGDDGITLASADHIAFSNRYIVYNEENEEEYSLFYSTLRDYSTRAYVDLSYGSLNNPIIIRNSEDFAKATGKATDVEISSYKQYYNDYEVFGHYRFVSDIDFGTIDQNLDDNNAIRLTTTTKDFTGILDGNGFTIHNMSLESSSVVENYGLFARIKDGSIMNLGLEVASVHNGNASIVGTLAGTAIDSRLVGLTLNPVDARDEEDMLVAISIHGHNIVGGVVGAVFGNSKLSDIIIEDIDVAANYYDENKEVRYEPNGNGIVIPNDNLVGETLKMIIEAGGSLKGNISSLSYAGGLAGYVDIYQYEDEENVTYTGSVDYSSYDLSTIRIYNSINIYGEVAGGFVGYLSATTIGYDMGLELDADMGLTNPSYITAKNLYAGGIVGESYGGLFASYAEYSRELQDTIEENMYSYYNGGTTVERGQTSIFSYTAEENDKVNKDNNPYFVGGLVGYAGGGYITTSYNRLNVVSNMSNHDDYEGYFGGLVGAVNADYYYTSETMLSRSQISYFMNETYFSGVLNTTTNMQGGGAIGLITSDSIVGLKNVNTMPYYENNPDNMSKLFGLIGGFETDVMDKGNISFKTPSHIYLLDNLNGHYDVVSGGSLAGGESPTTSIAVSALYLAQNDVTVNLATRYNYIFGYTDSLIKVVNPDLDETVTSQITNDRIMQVEWMKDLPTMELGYTKMNQYFLRNDWDPNYWEHEVNTLYPRIVLTPRTNVVFLDAYEESIRSVMEAIHSNSSLTVVVRGMIEPDNPSGGYTDVNLTGSYENGEPIIDAMDRATNFSGKFISYEEYMKTRSEGVISSQDVVVKGEGGYVLGGTAGENVGLILDQPIFKSVDYGFELNGLNIYYVNKEIGTTKSGYTSLLVARTATNATFTNLDIHLNSSLTLQADTSGMAGLLTAEAVSSDFLNINIIFRRDKDADTNASDILFNDSASDLLDGESQYFGILAGRMVQNSPYKGMTISNINFAVEEKTTGGSGSLINEATIKVDFDRTSDKSYSLFFGLLAGDSSIDDSANISTFRMTSLNRYLENDYNIEISLNNPIVADALKELYVGAYFGRANFTVIEGVLSDDNYPINGITINQGLKVETEYVGLGFGKVTGSGTMSISTNVEREVFFNVQGEIWHEAPRSISEGSATTAYVGGLIGQAEMNLISIDNTVKTEVFVRAPDYIGTFAWGKAYIGSLIGNLNGSLSAESFETKNTLYMVANERSQFETDIYYGLVGATSGASSVELGTGQDVKPMTSNDSVTIVNTIGDIYVGGVIGCVSSETVTNKLTIANYINKSTYKFSKCEYVVVGGVIADAKTTSYAVRTSGFGGKVVFDASEGYNLTVGGVIGVSKTSTEKSSILSAYSYGDVFVNYGGDVRLEEYNFGGMVGKYQTSETDTNKMLSIENSYSLMSTFNDRVTENMEDYNVNAFVGFGSESVGFSGNYYASGVTFALQQDTGNRDTYYIGKDSKATPLYYGYQFANDDVSASDVDIVNAIRNGILKIVAGGDVDKLDDIKKLNPIEVTKTYIEQNEANYVENEEDEKENAFDDYTEGTVNGYDLKWFYLSGSIGGDDDYLTAKIPLLENAVIVGNGQTINFKSSEGTADVGEEINGENYGFVQEMSTTYSTFSAITNLVINNTVNVVANANATIGGLVGMAGKYGGVSILYAVGVNGTITVGGTGSPVVSGIVGAMESDGMINNAYFDGDIYYSAGTDGTVPGTVSGIVYSQSHLEVFNTFSAGSIQTLAPPSKVSLFNNSEASKRVHIYDSYTIMQHFSSDYGYGTYTGEINGFVGETSKTFSDGDGGSYTKRSVGYGGNSYYKYSLDINREDIDEDKDGYIDVDIDAMTMNAWFYSPYKNYGYGTTGFGFLRNITISHRTTVNNATGDATGDAEETETVNYNYTNYKIDEISKIEDNSDYFYPILNNGQFNEMIKLSEGGTAEKDRQYMLRYDINSGLTRGKDFSTKDAPFTLDGRNNTLTLQEGEDFAIFDVVYGNLENLHFKDIVVGDSRRTVSGSNADGKDMKIYGTLANVTYGATIKNVSVQGTMDIEDEFKLVGGVVGVAISSQIIAVESVVDFKFTAGASNSIVGGVVGYALGSGKIAYCSNAGNIKIEDSYARRIGDSVYSAEKDGGNDLPKISFNEQDLTLSKVGDKGISITTSNKGNGYETSDQYHLTSYLSSILGGVVGVTEVPVSYSFNTASIINGYKQFKKEETHQVGAVVSGGIVGYATSEISNSFNTGYIVSGNMFNKFSNIDGNAYGYPTLAGGIVGYSKFTLSKCYNDGKIQAVSYLDKSDFDVADISGSFQEDYWYSITDPNPEHGDDFGEMLNKSLGNGYNNDATMILKIRTSMKYNETHKDRTSFAYALGYGIISDGNSSTNGKNAEIVNDGNIGYIYIIKDFEKEYTLQRYYGVIDGGDQYGIKDKVDFKVGKDGTPSVVTSGYDSYGFPNRLNVYYDYTFDMAIEGVFNAGQFWGKSDNQMKITIKDDKVYSTKDEDLNAIKVSADPYTENSAMPGGTTHRYISIPFYKADGTGYDGYSYEEYMYRLNNTLSLYNGAKTTSSGNDISGELSELYNEIKEFSSDNSTERKFNIRGEDYSMVFNSNQLAAYTKGVTFSGEVEITEAPTLSENGRDINSSGIRVKDMTFTLKGGTGNEISPLSYSAHISTRDDNGTRKYYINYSVYYDKEEVYNKFNIGAGGNLDDLSINVNYDVEYTFTDTITLSKNNVEYIGGSQVIFKVPDVNTNTAQSFRDFFNSQNIADIQDEKLQVTFGGISDKVIEPLKENGNYYIIYDKANSGDAYARFNDTGEAEAFLQELKNGSATLSFSYYTLGSGEYEAYDLVNNVTNSLTSPTVEYVIGIDDYVNAGTVEANGGYVTLNDTTPNRLTLHFNAKDDASSGAIKIVSSLGEIYYYPNGINGDTGNKFAHSLNITGTGITINTSSLQNYMDIDFTNATDAYGKFMDAIESGVVYVASRNDDNDSITVPKTQTRTVQGNINVVFVLDTSDTSNFSYEESGDNYVVSRNPGSTATTFRAIYKYSSASFTNSTESAQFFNSESTLAYIKNQFTLQANATDQIAGIRDSKGATYEFTTGTDTIYGLNPSGSSYVQTTITYQGVVQNIYRFSDGSEIKEYDFDASSYIVDNGGNTYLVDKTTDSPSPTSTSRIDESRFYTNPSGNLSQFTLSGIAQQEGGLYLSYTGGLYTGSNIASYAYNASENTATYRGAVVTDMFLLYSLSSGSYTFYIITEDATEAISVSMQPSSDWFVSDLPDFYFVATKIEDGGTDGSFRNQIITFDEARLENIISNKDYNNFEVKEYTRSLSDTQMQIQLVYGDSSKEYTVSGADSWDTSDTSSNFVVSDAYQVTINDELSENGASFVPFGNHSGNVVFKGTVSGTGKSYTVPDDEKDSIINSLKNSQNANNIILGNNAYYDGNIALNGATLYGDGHILNLFGDMSIWKNMIEVNNGGLIDNTTFVFMVDLSDFDYQGDTGDTDYSASLIYLGLGVEDKVNRLNKVKLFGALRNITSNTTNADGDVINRNSGSGTLSTRNVYMLSFSSGSKVNSVTSYMTMQGNSAVANENIAESSDSLVNGTSVSVVLDISTSVDASNSFVVLGDGANGSNGTDGTGSTKTGFNGGNGGKAGVIQNAGMEKTATNKDVATATVFNGIDGVGGNGGNGADGKNATGRSEISKGGGSGGAYGLDGAYYTWNVNNEESTINYDGTAYSTRLLSNRRQADANTKMLDDTYRSALGGSGGAGGLGLIYYNTSASEIQKMFNNGEGGGGLGSKDKPKFAPYDSTFSYYVTAAGGGAASVRYTDHVFKGASGEGGKLCPSSGLDYSNSIIRGTLKGNLYGEISFVGIKWGNTDISSRAYHSYFWSTPNENFSDEFLFGNLQYIPAFSHWYVETNYHREKYDPEEYDDIYKIQTITVIIDGNAVEFEVDFGGATAMKENAGHDVDTDVYEKFLYSYIYMSHNLEKYDTRSSAHYASNSWKKIFYGGIGGNYEGVELEGHLYLCGGTSYTKEIYGYTTSKGSWDLMNMSKDQFFFSRNDMVTSGGYYGTAQGLISQGAPNWTE